MEDFGWNGDEFLTGDCQDDWRADLLDMRADDYAERQALLRELAEDEEADRADFESDAGDDPYYPEDDDCPLDGDAQSALASIGWGTDEDYGYFGGGEDW